MNRYILYIMEWTKDDGLEKGYFTEFHELGDSEHKVNNLVSLLRRKIEKGEVNDSLNSVDISIEDTMEKPNEFGVRDLMHIGRFNKEWIEEIKYIINIVNEKVV